MFTQSVSLWLRLSATGLCVFWLRRSETSGIPTSTRERPVANQSLLCAPTRILRPVLPLYILEVNIVEILDLFRDPGLCDARHRLQRLACGHHRLLKPLVTDIRPLPLQHDVAGIVLAGPDSPILSDAGHLPIAVVQRGLPLLDMGRLHLLHGDAARVKCAGHNSAQALDVKDVGGPVLGRDARE